MAVHSRAYGLAADFALAHAFLTELYQPGNADGQWFAPIWEYALWHPWFDAAHADANRLWFEGDQVVAMVCYELYLGEAFFAVRPGYELLFADMLDHAEAHLGSTDDHGGRRLQVYLTDQRPEWLAAVAARGYQRRAEDDRPMCRLAMPEPFPATELPDGYRLTTLAEDNNLAELHRLLHRGFGHGDEPEDDGLADRRQMQRAPHYRHDLQVVVVSPVGRFVAYAGMWYDPVNRFGYVEPVCTDPDHRRLGLGTAAVLEGVRRCGLLGADCAYVGSTQPFYQSMGFRYLHRQECWRRDGCV